jgi:sodium/hydrogen antiporter
MISLAVFVSLLFLYSLLSRRLERTIVTAPIVFTLGGMLTFPGLQGILRAGFTGNIALRVAEVGLVMLLFTDASRTDLNVLRNIRNLPARLLSAGMLLTIFLGAVVARLVFPHLSIWEAGILSAILAPTDAGLGQIIVNSPRVPMPIRQALNVEAGLNDGLSVPFLLFFIAIAAAKIEGGPASLLQFIVEQLGLGALIGLTIGLAGGWLLRLARRKEWIAESFQPIGVVALPLLCLGRVHTNDIYLG